MSKTITLRVADSVYEMIKLIADGKRRNLSNFIENITSQYVNDSKVQDILKDTYE